MKKQIGILGLGRMGSGIALNAIDSGWDVVGYNRSPNVTKELEAKGIKGAYSLKELKDKLSTPRVIWIMVPAGSPVDEVIFGEKGLKDLLDPRDIIVDAGNSYYKDAQKRHEKLKEKNIKFLDVGVSGGPGGARNGACLMVGGSKDTYDYLRPFFIDITVENGEQFFEGIGAGHFVKMVHNGIEYGMMQSIAEGFNIMRSSSFNLNLTDITNIYNHGSVVESRLVGWLQDAFKEYGNDLEKVSGSVGSTGEGEWTVKAGKELDAPVPIIEGSYNFRVQSQESPSYIGKLLSGMRNQFGRHSIKPGERT